MRSQQRHVFAFSGFLVLSACGSDEPSATSDIDASSVDAGGGVDAGMSTAGDAGTSSETIGEFSLQLVAPVAATSGVAATPGFTALLGKVYDGPQAEAIAWAKESEAGGCTLLVPRVPFCDPACGTSVCVADDVCRPQPVGKSVGKVTVKGVKTESGATDFSVEPIQKTYQAGSVKLPYPAFDEGGTITLVAAGAELPGFTLTGRGIAPLTLSTTGAFPIAAGKPLALTWEKAKVADVSRIAVRLDISHHGGSKGKIECDVPDDGVLSIPAALLDRLVSLGVAGFPTVIVTRTSLGTVAIPAGKVNLRVYSYVERAVELPGVTSCNDDRDCPTGKTCRDDLICK